MWLFSFYRFYFCAALSIAAYLFVASSIALAAGLFAGLRILIWLAEKAIENSRIKRSFKTHESRFKQEFGPYGIRLANSSRVDRRVRASLAEVFTPNLKILAKTVDQLVLLDALFSAGLRPDGDAYLLHDLKLKYGRLRLEQKF